MTITRRFVLLVLVAASVNAADEGKLSPNNARQWAIVATDSTSGALAELLTATISSWPNVQLVERAEIKRVLAELELNASGLIAPGARRVSGSSATPIRWW